MMKENTEMQGLENIFYFAVFQLGMMNLICQKWDASF